MHSCAEIVTRVARAAGLLRRGVARRSRDPTAEMWKYDGAHDAVFSSFSEAARTLLKNLKAGGRRGSFSLTHDRKAWAKNPACQPEHAMHSCAEIVTWVARAAGFERR